MKQRIIDSIKLEKIVGGGQALATDKDGRKVFVWGGLPNEEVSVRVTKKKSKLLEARVESVISASPERVEPRDPESFISTSPWQIMKFDSEQSYKAELIKEAFRLHDITLPNEIKVYSDGREWQYRNKVEFSWFGSEVDGKETLDLAFFNRGTKGKVAVEKSALMPDEVVKLANSVKDLLTSKGVTGRELKTLLIRNDANYNCVWQLYVKSDITSVITLSDLESIEAQGGEVIFSEPRSPASVITKRLLSYGNTTLGDKLLDIPFQYAAESFFQVNIPVYEETLSDIKPWIESNKPLVDLYAGVGSIGLSLGSQNCTMVEINESAIREMEQNIKRQSSGAVAVHTSSETALDYITQDATIIVDPPRAGLHLDVIDQLLSVTPGRVIYLSCNPATQARDVKLLWESYDIEHHQGYNYFPKTPHIEHLVVLRKR